MVHDFNPPHKPEARARRCQQGKLPRLRRRAYAANPEVQLLVIRVLRQLLEKLHDVAVGIASICGAQGAMSHHLRGTVEGHAGRA